ncbi:MAG TPA: energy transducer TonB, partial [Steroidobacteraceae bacterium]|nr:energy transducer TonB [Steroidobacteraceae bacterium]
TFVDKTRPPDEPPPPPREVPLERYESVVRPDYIPETAFDQPDAITEPPVVDTFEEPRGPVVVQPEIVSVRQDPRHPLSKPPYSARMIREGSQGTIDLEVFVQPNGRVSDARVVKSTGFEELDLAALAEAKRNWRLLPATRDGVPIAQWHRLRVTFKLNER